MQYVILKVDETVTLVDPAGNRIEVMLVEVKHSHAVRLGVTAPRSIKVLRSELVDRDPGVSAPKRR